MATITKTQMEALRWMADFPSNKAEWRRNGKAAYGHPDKWDAMKLEGKRGSIIIAVADWRALVTLIAGGPVDGDKIYAPTPTGLNILAAAPSPSDGEAL